MLNPSLFDASATGMMCAHDHASRVFGDDDLLYYPHFLPSEEARALFAALLSTIAWKQESIAMFGRNIPMPRLTAWYGDSGASYTYSGLRNDPNPWTIELLLLADRLEQFLDVRFNSVLLNRYRDGNDSLSWHADDEPELGDTPVIASISLGATRTFKLRKADESREQASLDLESGSLLLMQGQSQKSYRHAVPKDRNARGERINLTFRVVSTGTTTKGALR